MNVEEEEEDIREGESVCRELGLIACKWMLYFFG